MTPPDVISLRAPCCYPLPLLVSTSGANEGSWGGGRRLLGDNKEHTS